LSCNDFAGQGAARRLSQQMRIMRTDRLERTNHHD